MHKFWLAAWQTTKPGQEQTVRRLTIQEGYAIQGGYAVL